MTASIWAPNGFSPEVIPFAFFEGVAIAGQTVIDITPYTAIQDSQLQVFVSGALVNTNLWSVAGTTVVLSIPMTVGQTYRVDVYAAAPTAAPSEVIYADDYKLATDPDDTLSIQRVLNLGKTCYLYANKEYTASGLVSVANTALVCNGGRATIKVPLGADLYGILIKHDGFILQGVNFNGQNLGPYNSGAGVFGTRNGIIVGNAFGTGVSIRNIVIKDVDCYGFDVAGIQGREIQVGYNFGKSVSLENVYCHHCLVGIWASPRFEYIAAELVNLFECYAGLILQGGNNTWTGLKTQWCFQNIQMTTGENDAHGQFIGGDCNHAYGAGYGLYATDVVYGQTITGMAFWYAPIYLKYCTGIFIRHGQIAGGAPPVTIDQNTGLGGICGIDDNWTPGGLSVTLVNPIHFTSFRRNRRSSTDTTFQATYGDVHMIARASSVAFPIAFNASSDTAFALVFNDQKRWHGNTASFLEYAASRAYIPRTGKYHFAVSVTYSNPATAEKVDLKLIRYAGVSSTINDFEPASAYFPASATGCTVSRECIMNCTNGDTLGITLRVPTGNTISISSLIVRIDSID